MTKTIVGLIEQIKVIDARGISHALIAKIDTGADTCSIDSKTAEQIGLGPIVKTKRVISSHGKSTRPVVNATIIIKGRKMIAPFTVIDRSGLKYKALIGNNVLKKDFIIDPSLEQ